MIVNTINCGSVNEVADIYQAEHGEVISCLLKGLKLKDYNLVKDIVHALYKLLNSRVEGVYDHMVELDALMYFDTLNHHTNQGVFEAAQDLIELVEHLNDEMDCEFVIEDKPPKNWQEQHPEQ